MGDADRVLVSVCEGPLVSETEAVMLRLLVRRHREAEELWDCDSETVGVALEAVILVSLNMGDLLNEALALSEPGLQVVVREE